MPYLAMYKYSDHSEINPVSRYSNGQFFTATLSKQHYSTQLKVKTRLRELAPADRGSQDAGSRNLVFTFYLSTDVFSAILSPVPNTG